MKLQNLGKMMVCSALLLMSGCNASTQESKQKVTIVLDYVINTNHTGLYVAKEKGYFDEVNLDVEIIEPGDNTTSLAIVASGQANFGISYQEDVTYALANNNPMPIKAVATIMQNNTSGIVVKKGSSIKTPKDFEGKTYAGWQSESEEMVLKALMKKYGGDPSQLSIVGGDGSGYRQLDHGVDLIWDFRGWGLMKADLEGFSYEYYPLKDFDERLNYYTPVIVGNQTMIEKEKKTTTNFIQAVKKGYEYAAKNPQEAAKILSKYAPEYDLQFLEKSQIYVSSQYCDAMQNWGMMQDKVWNQYTTFMFEQGLIEENIPANLQYTNEFLIANEN